MLIISKALSAARVRTYYAEEFASAHENSFSKGDRIFGQWHGHLALQWGLSGDVQAQHVWRIADGCHPHSGSPLVRHQTPRTYLNARGQKVKRMAHRAGWDATFRAPKSVSLTAVVGGDARVRQAHHDSVAVAVDQLERDVQTRFHDSGAETTRNWVAAMFEHDRARPVDGYTAPQLHTHVVIFNLTHASKDRIRAVEPLELYRSQHYITAVYRSELAARLGALGYELERGGSGQPEIRGYTAEYLLASSPRSQQIQERLARLRLTGPEAEYFSASRTREPKLESAGVENAGMQRRHRELALAFGDQPMRVVHAAHVRARRIEPHSPGMTAHAAVTLAMDRSLERRAFVDERTVLEAALQHSMGEVTFGAIKADFERRVEAGEFVALDRKYDIPRRALTTREMIAVERDAIRIMRNGQRREDPLASDRTRFHVQNACGHLSERQQQALHHVLASGDRIMALEGTARGDATAVAAAVRDAAEREGYKVQEFAPHSPVPPDGHDRLYVVAESSLGGARRLHAFFNRLGTHDRVLLVHSFREIRGRHAASAGRLYQELQEGGMNTIRLDGTLRQAERGPAIEQSKEQRPERQYSFGLGLGL
jgi:conjugative relaxase-like TrwC/TraI family protein